MSTVTRRRFLTTLGAGGAAAAAALATRSGVSAQTADKAVATEQPRQTGYRVTPHIRNYYRTARV